MAGWAKWISAAVGAVASGVAAPAFALPDIEAAAPAPGAAAAPLFSEPTGADYQRAATCLTEAVYYEAASEPLAGQRAVAQVVLNRVKRPGFPKSVCGVVFEGSSRSTGCQFTFTCDGSLERRPAAAKWEVAQSVAADALAGYVDAGVGAATHYHANWMTPYWSSSMVEIARIGAHIFYRSPGAQPLDATYAGAEPLAPAPAAPRVQDEHPGIRRRPPTSSTFAVWGLNVATVTPTGRGLAIRAAP